MKKQNKEEEQPQKALTRYDQKMEKRRIAARKNARDERIFNMACIAAGIIIAAAVAIGVTMSVINKNKAYRDTYVTIGTHQITGLEYGYYYNMTVNNYINSYGSILSYMGLDTTKDYAGQSYSETMSWKDAFDEMTVSQLTRTKALADDAAAAGFSADVTADYNSFTESIAQAAQTSGVSLSRYYKASFGRYATKDSVAPFVKENLLTEAYYSQLLEQNTPSDEEVDSYYEENKNNYDKVSYRSYVFTSDQADDASETQSAGAMEQIREQAEEMKSRREAGADFRELCLEYAGENDKAAYQDAGQDASLTENAAYTSVPAAIQDWLFDESRAAGDITAAADEAGRQYYVVEFAGRIYDETSKDTIGSTLAEERVSEYITSLTASYEVTDLSGELIYLTVQNTEETIEAAETEASEETEAAAE